MSPKQSVQIIPAIVEVSSPYEKEPDQMVDGGLLALKVDQTQQIESYTKTDDDTLLLLKPNVADVNNKEETFNMVEQGKKDVATQTADKND
ncbi:MAG: hypothetical protein EZS28_002582 [Streblomastix strix]|uniref:Uncharacterized protein n=1 Tax=Streblomastix strix TaxID=222440 RepID=A0A5J4X5I2_9EUKA|nr:MAG: hypothetical protein EZS28_002582 [Streblomastix strix]